MPTHAAEQAQETADFQSTLASIITGLKSFRQTGVDQEELDRNWDSGLYGTGVVVQNISSVAILTSGDISMNSFYEAWPEVSGNWTYGNTDYFAILSSSVQSLSVSGIAYFYPDAELWPTRTLLVPYGVLQAGGLPSCYCQSTPIISPYAEGPVTVTFRTPQ